MFEDRLRCELHAAPQHDGEADAFTKPHIANWECRRLLDRIVPQRQYLDAGGMDIATATGKVWSGSPAPCKLRPTL